MIELFKLEVPEVGQGLVAILAPRRDPGDRAKIAVLRTTPHRSDRRLHRHARFARAGGDSNEIERRARRHRAVDDNAAQFVINAMAPAEVQSIIVDEDKHSMDIAVAEDKLAQAIGRGGQNVRLASELTGWQLNVMTADQVRPSRRASGAARRASCSWSKLEVDEEIAGDPGAGGLQHRRGNRLRAASELPDRGLRRGHRRGTAHARPRRAADEALAVEETLVGRQPAEDLLRLEGMDESSPSSSPRHGIVTREDLAEQAVGRPRGDPTSTRSAPAS